ncbi:MAG: hypothetical protein LW834_06425 [Cyanobium sp. 49614_E6]|jgi:hypothetical protein|nr:hypothetical protein [Cyanobium sp. 49614_E6]
MDHKQIINQAIEQVLSERLLLSPGDTACHSSDSMSYVFHKYENGSAIVGWDGVTKSFPMREVFDPNIVQARAIDIKLGLA